MDESILKSIASQLRQPSGENARQVGEKMNEGNFHINMNTIDTLNLNEGDTILEIGMGNGNFVKNILQKNLNITYTGFDHSEIMVEEAKKRNQNFVDTKQVSFLHGNMNDLPFETASFDKIFTINTIYFWEDPKVVLAEFKRVLKPEGEITIALRPKSIMQHYAFVKYGFTMYDPSELKQLMVNNGFKIIDTFEQEEPEVELNGEQTKTATLIIKVSK